LKLLSAIIKKIFIFIIKVYQLLLSPIFGKQCRFTPTCSNYSKEAIEMHGPFSGMILTIKRLLRCHPWAKSGHDPVPEK